MVLGVCLLLSSMGLLFGNRTQASQAEEVAQTLLPELLVQIEATQAPWTQTVPAAPVDTTMTEKEVGGYACIGYLSIPALELELPVLSQWDYAGLKVAPCRYAGSLYRNDLILCAHNYSSHFGKLKNLQVGDTAIFTDMDENAVIFEMVERETLNPTDVEGMETGDWDLTLFTCTVGGQSRVTLRFARAEP